MIVNCLLQQSTKWVWSSECNKAFETAKEKVVSAKVLAHYDSEQDIYSVDASAYGIGAVLSHIDRMVSKGTSRTLTQAECNDSQLALSIIFDFISSCMVVNFD